MFGWYVVAGFCFVKGIHNVVAFYKIRYIEKKLNEKFASNKAVRADRLKH